MKSHTDASGPQTGWRNLISSRRLPFKLGVIATLAIAIGANIAVLGNLGVLFGPVVPGAMHRDLIEPYFRASNFKALSSSQLGMFRPIYDGFTRRLQGRADTALYHLGDGEISHNGANPQHMVYLSVTPSLAQVLGVQLIAGRMLNADDSLPGAAPVIVISENLADTQFGGPHAALGQMLTMSGKAYRIVGVLPAKLAFPSGDLSQGPAIDAWLPFPPETTGSVGNINFNTHALIYPLGPLSSGTLLSALADAYREALPRYNSGMRGFIQGMDLHPQMTSLAEREYGPVLANLAMLEVAAVLLLLLVLANLSGLATTDALARRQEFATRTALGAGPLRLFAGRVRELLALGFIGWVIGIGLGWLGSHALTATVGQAGGSVVFSAPVLLATLGAVIVIALLLSLTGMRRLRAPGAIAIDISSSQHSTGGRALARTLRALVIVQLVASLILLVTTAHLQANVFSLKHGDFGFTPTQRTFLRVGLPGSNGDQTEVQHEAFVKQAYVFDQTLLARTQALPGVKASAILSLSPFSESVRTGDIRSAPGAKPQLINIQTVSRDIVPALGLRVLAGNSADIFNGSESALLLDESAARAVWPEIPNTQAVGRDIYIDGKPWRVAAVVKPLRMRPYGSIGGTMFMPMSKPSSLSGGPQRFVVNSTLAPQTLRAELTNIVHQINPQANISGYYTGDQLIEQAYATRDRLTQIFGLLASVTLVIAVVGLFALLAYRALVRRPEFAIRGALGATPARLFTYVLAEAAVLWFFGCMIGLPLAYMLSSELAVRLPALGLIAPWISAAVALALGMAAMAAALVPALRVSHTALAQNLKQ